MSIRGLADFRVGDFSSGTDDAGTAARAGVEAVASAGPFFSAFETRVDHRGAEPTAH